MHVDWFAAFLVPLENWLMIWWPLSLCCNFQQLGLPVLLPPAKAKLKSLFVLPFHTHGGFKHWISRGHNKAMTLLIYTGTILIVAICSVMVDARYGSGATLCCCSCRHKDCRSSTWWVRCSCSSCQKGHRSFTWWICCSHCGWNNDYRSSTWTSLTFWYRDRPRHHTSGAYGQHIKELEQIISWLDVSTEFILSHRCTSCLIHVPVKWLWKQKVDFCKACAATPTSQTKVSVR